MAIAIIGAGMAGLAAGRKLADAGQAVTIFDKSRGLGGRMATRRVDAMAFDHGAQYFTAKGAAFRAVVDGWRAQGHAADWFEGAHVGAPGMTAPARALAQGLDVVTSCQVSDLHRAPDGWTILDKDGPVATPGNGAFAHVVLAVPAPQALPLAASADVAFEAMERAVYAPCWALLLAFAQPTGLPDHAKHERGAISWIARNASKPGRAPQPETLVVHASPDWSRQHLELTPEEAGERLLAHFTELTGVRDRPDYASAHRWRFALVETPAGAPFLFDEDSGLGACGDWCLGPRVEAAFDSGEALAARILAFGR